MVEPYDFWEISKSFVSKISEKVVKLVFKIIPIPVLCQLIFDSCRKKVDVGKTFKTSGAVQTRDWTMKSQGIG